MNCKDAREHLIELLEPVPADPALRAHVNACGDCARELESLRQTMALMDEWEAPEPSPYFLTRLQAHVREEQRKPARLFAWLRRPAMVVSLAAALVVGAVSVPLVKRVLTKNPEPSTAVSDLDSLDRNHDLLLNTDLLDEMSGGPSDDVTDSDI